MKSLINHETNELNYYFGGYFESRHSICIAKIKVKNTKRVLYQLRLKLFSPEKSVIKLFKQNFGGCTISKNNKKYAKPKNTKWWWSCNSEATIDFLYAIKPYIQGKKLLKKVELAIRFRKFQLKSYRRWGNTKSSNKIRKKREEFYQEMRRLNKKR